MAVERLADDIAAIGSEETTVDVQISYDVIKLFSEQLYASPLKAIEELVVNSWDAGAETCSTLVNTDGERPLIAVFDDGKGMTPDELKDLWHIGVSHKVGLQAERKQIGKFGIGKLASYAVARRATYVSRTAAGVYAVSINFEVFATATAADGKIEPVTLTIRRLESLGALASSGAFEAASSVLTLPEGQVDLNATPTWTLVVLEDLKEKAYELKIGRLRWVLETAMPLAADFNLHLNGNLVESSKDKYEKQVAFTVHDLEDERLADLSASTGETWRKTADGVSSPSFPSGVTGEVFVTKKSLYAEGGKSEDLGRSHGFFVRVHNRLINESEPLFGARPLSFTTWYRFAAIVEVSDLNAYVTASRDDVEQSDVKVKLRALLIQLFNQARDQYEALQAVAAEDKREKKEGRRDHVPIDLVERPLADALLDSVDDTGEDGGEPKRPWRLIAPIPSRKELQTLVEDLYSAERSTRAYIFRYSPAGALAPIARLDLAEAVFHVNEDHELVREFSTTDGRRLLEAFIVAETVLEAHLRVADVPWEIIDEVMDRRDALLRALGLDESYSLTALAQALRDASDQDNDLEIAMVGALRALGFTARHIGGSGTPDGEAAYIMHGIENVSFTLEAKSSGSVPSLGHLDFAGLRSHYEALNAKGCLLVAPTYPNLTDPQSEVAVRAQQQGVSCWTIAQLADVVATAERRHITAPRIQEIVMAAFAPLDVTVAVGQLLSEPTYDKVDLYTAVIKALVDLEHRLRGTQRNVTLIAGEVSRNDAFADVDTPEIRDAITDLAHSSRGLLRLTDDDTVHLLGSIEELRRRVVALTNDRLQPRRRGNFRREDDAPTT